MATDAPPPQPESGHVHVAILPIAAATTMHHCAQQVAFLRLLRRFPLPEPTILNPYRTVIQELTKGRHESRGSPGVKLYLFAGIGEEPHLPSSFRKA